MGESIEMQATSLQLMRNESSPTLKDGQRADSKLELVSGFEHYEYHKPQQDIQNIGSKASDEPNWRPMCAIQSGDLLDFETKKAYMNDLSNKLTESNEEYLRGKALRLDNKAHYIQCVPDPNPDVTNGFIAVQTRTKLPQFHAENDLQPFEEEEVRESGRIPPLATMEYIKLESEKNLHLIRQKEGKQNKSNYGSIWHVSSMKQDEKPEFECENMTSTIISFWQQNDKIAKGQQDCYKYIVEKNVIMSKLSKTISESSSGTRNYEAYKCLFTGQNNSKIFFFSRGADPDEDGAIVLNIIDQTTKSDKAEWLNPQNYPDRINDDKSCLVTRFKISIEGNLTEELKNLFGSSSSSDLEVQKQESQMSAFQMGGSTESLKQLGTFYTEEAKTDFYQQPEITIITYKSKDYLVLFFHNRQTNLPQLNFYKVWHQESKFDTMSGEPTFKILGAELLCGINEYDDTISYLTNQQIQDRIRHKKHTEDFIADQARLRSPSYIKQIKIKSLIDNEVKKFMLQQQQALKAMLERHEGIASPKLLGEADVNKIVRQDSGGEMPDSEQLKLYTDPQSMIFFRTESYAFPKVQVFPILQENITPGVHDTTKDEPSKSFTSITLLFQGHSKWPDVAVHFRIVQEIQPVPKGKFFGNYRTQEDIQDEQIEIQLNPKIEDQKPEDAITQIGNSTNDSDFTVNQKVDEVSWVPAKLSKQTHKFQIQKLSFDQNGDIQEGTATLEGPLGQAEDYNLRVCKNTQNDFQSLYPDEKSFELEFTKHSDEKDTEEDEPVATISGTFRNDPFDVIIYGQFCMTVEKHSKIEQYKQNFALQKRTIAQLILVKDFQTIPFDVEIIGGAVSERENKITLNNSHEPQLTFDHVHQVVVGKQSETYILSGNLMQLIDKSLGGLDVGSSRNSIIKLESVTQTVTQSVAGSAADSQALKNLATVKRDEITQFSPQSGLQKIWQSQESTDNLLQGLIVNKNPQYSIILAALAPDPLEYRSDSLKFFTQEEADQKLEDEDLAGEDANEALVSGVIETQEIVEYPIIVYNSYLPTNSELVVTSLAEKDQKSQVVRLGQYLRFITFVDSPCIVNNLRDEVDEITGDHCLAFFLAWNSKLEQLVLMALGVEPWARQKKIALFSMQTRKISMPPRSLDELRRVYMLYSPSNMSKIDKQKKQKPPRYSLVYQMEDNLFYQSITEKFEQEVQPVLDLNTKMNKRYAVRRPFDLKQIYCLVEQGPSDHIIRLELGKQGEGINCENIYSSIKVKFLALEPNPEDPNQLFVVDNYENVLVISDQVGVPTKAEEIIETPEADIEVQLQNLQETAWDSVIVNRRVLTIGNKSFSLNSGLVWTKKLSKSGSGEVMRLVSEVSLPNALSSLQRHHVIDDRSIVFYCKPLRGSYMVNLMGQERSLTSRLGKEKDDSKQKNKEFFLAGDDRVLVQTESPRLLVFDKDGYICHDKIECIGDKKFKVIKQSHFSKEYGKFFLLKNAKIKERNKGSPAKFMPKNDEKEHYKLVQSYNNEFREVLVNLTDQSIQNQFTKTDSTHIMEKLLSMINKDEEKSAYQYEQFEFTARIDSSFLSANGDLTVIATVIVYDLEEKSNENSNLTIFDSSFGTEQDDKDSDNLQKLFGFYKFDNIRVVYFICKDTDQERKIQECLQMQSKFPKNKQNKISKSSTKAKDNNKSSGINSSSLKQSNYRGGEFDSLQERSPKKPAKDNNVPPPAQRLQTTEQQSIDMQHQSSINLLGSPTHTETEKQDLLKMPQSQSPSKEVETGFQGIEKQQTDFGQKMTEKKIAETMKSAFSSQIASSLLKSQSQSQRKTDEGGEDEEDRVPDYVFGFVGSQYMVWLNVENSQIEYVDLQSAIEDFDDQNDQNNELESDLDKSKIQWKLLDCKSFSVKELIDKVGQTRQRTEQGYFNIGQIPKESVLVQKNGRIISQYKDEVDIESLMQLTIGQMAVVYNLKADSRQEIAMISNLYDFKDPVIFSHTGFNYTTSQLALEISETQSFGIQRPWKKKTARALYRAVSAIDLKQIKRAHTISKEGQNRSNNEKLNKMEFGTLLRIYNGETFFTLFTENETVYENILKKRIYEMQNDTDSKKYKTDFIRLSFVLTRPTKVHLKDGRRQVYDLNILKQSLAFKKQLDKKKAQARKIEKKKKPQAKPPEKKKSILDIKGAKKKFTRTKTKQQTKAVTLMRASPATIRIFRIAAQCNIYLTDLIDCVDDLRNIVELLPTQEYQPFLNKLEVNLYTQGISEAMMDRAGDKSLIKTFTKSSMAIDNTTAELGLLQQVQNQSEALQKVQVKVLPLDCIMAFKPDEELFIFLRVHQEDLQDSLLLNAIFSAFWQKQKKLISVFIFAPFALFLATAAFYYTQFMYTPNSKQGIWIVLCPEEATKLDECPIYENFTLGVRTIFILLLAWQIFIEINQMIKEGIKAYFNDINILDDAVIIINGVTLALHATDSVSLTLLRQIAALGLMCVWLQMFFWFRLFDGLARYVDLIGQTVGDIAGFMFVFLELMAMFMVVFYMLQINRVEQGQILYDYNEVDDNPEQLYYAFANQVKIFLGDFSHTFLIRNPLNVSDEEKDYIFLENCFVYLIFLGSIFVGQVVIMNMLISIMAQTYANQLATQTVNGNRQKLKLVSEYSSLLTKIQKIFCACQRANESEPYYNLAGRGSQQRFLFVVTPHKDDEDLDQGSGTGGNDFGLMRKVLDKKLKETQATISKEIMEKLSVISQETGKRFDDLECASHNRNQETEKRLEQFIGKRFDEIKSSFTSETQTFSATLQDMKSTMEKNLKD